MRLVSFLPIITCIQSVVSAPKGPTSSNDVTTKTSSSLLDGAKHINIFSHDSGVSKSGSDDNINSVDPAENDEGATYTSNGPQQDTGLFPFKASKASSVGYGYSMSYDYLLKGTDEQSSSEYPSKASKSSSVGYGRSMSYGYLIEDVGEQSSSEYSSKESKSDHSMSYGYLIDDKQSSSEYSSKASKSASVGHSIDIDDNYEESLNELSLGYISKSSKSSVYGTDEFVDSLSYIYGDINDQSSDHSSKSSKPNMNQV